jgi:hypothetical protein
VDREVRGVVLENEGKSAPHRLHLDPDEIQSSRHHHLNAVPGDQSDDSDEWDAQESEEEWDGPGDVTYRDYRRMQRGTFLIAHIMRREEAVRKEMGRWMRVMERLGAAENHPGGTEEFGLDCHDMNLENVFVDENDHTKIVSFLLTCSLMRDLMHRTRHALLTGSLRLPGHSGHARIFQPSCNPVSSRRAFSGTLWRIWLIVVSISQCSMGRIIPNL